MNLFDYTTEKAPHLHNPFTMEWLPLQPCSAAQHTQHTPRWLFLASATFSCRAITCGSDWSPNLGARTPQIRLLARADPVTRQLSLRGLHCSIPGVRAQPGLQQHRMQVCYLQLGVVSMQLLHHVLGLAHAAAQLRRVLSRGQLAVVRLQDRPHPIALLPGTTENLLRIELLTAPLPGTTAKHSGVQPQTAHPAGNNSKTF